MTFTHAELEFLRSQSIGRLGTVGPGNAPQIRPVGMHLADDAQTIEVLGHQLAATQKWRNVQRNPQVAFIVDEVLSIDPPRARGIEIRGRATAIPAADSGSTRLSGDVIRIEPQRIISWGLDQPQVTARNV
ncbi:PPOX class F420-dependent oxidoreductase [Nocardia cyriacigeorgica]|uniref:PPOX class F420-dependent oxidoreductase n=1 Tax=Nocardia cyriacigeorgica TaxID=135487 RepID=UPI001894B216|nr:PPOX class F420-dependent oxidoreductase [Nocardia cyriacigeorgica]MBF6081312.1 PPOX class F420-dependent oxidoreductase [Nocardia cyriacigeorgica]